MTTSTSMVKIYMVIDKTMVVHRVPESITSDNGPPYCSQEWKNYGKECGFTPIYSLPEHFQSNGIVERFMAVLAKVIHCSVTEGRDPRAEVKRCLLNY